MLASVACAEQSSTLTGEQQYPAFKDALTDDQPSVRYEDYRSSFLMNMLESSDSAEERAQLETQSSFLTGALPVPVCRSLCSAIDN